MKPLMSGAKTEDEGLFVVQHRHWHQTMEKALAGTAAGVDTTHAKAAE